MPIPPRNEPFLPRLNLFCPYFHGLAYHEGQAPRPSYRWPLRIDYPLQDTTLRRKSLASPTKSVLL